MKSEQISEDFIINFDQTNVDIVPVSDYILEQEDPTQVQIIGFEDKRQITVLLGVRMSGHFIPSKIICAGLADMCHPKFKFPDL